MCLYTHNARCFPEKQQRVCVCVCSGRERVRITKSDTEREREKKIINEGIGTISDMDNTTGRNSNFGKEKKKKLFFTWRRRARSLPICADRCRGQGLALGRLGACEDGFSGNRALLLVICEIVEVFKYCVELGQVPMEHFWVIEHMFVNLVFL